jgi:hypothetical protein
MRTTLTWTSVAAALALSIYLSRLTARTAFFARAAAVGADTAIFVCILCLVALLCSLSAVKLKAEPHWLSVAVLVASSLLSLTYLILFVGGKFGPIGPKV